MKIAVIGLGKMGYQIVEKLIGDGIEVIALDRDETLISATAKLGAIPAANRADVISKFSSEPIVVWLMIPASVVDEEIAAWQMLLPKNSVLIDGGNSDYRLSQKRGEQLQTREIKFLDVGTSGGVLGAKNGFSMMVGGPADSFEQLLPVFKALSQPNGAYDYFGPNGRGHFVKMVHNAIEYGLMESLAEGYHLLKEGPFKGLDLAKVAGVWQHGSIVESSLNGLAQQALTENPNLDGIEGIVAETGEVSWTLEAAKQLNIDMPVTEAAHQVRLNSQNGKISYATKLLAALRNKFGGHSENPK